MVSFSAIIERFSKQGEKTGWTYIIIPAAIANKINPGVKKSFRVKGTLDMHTIKQVALMPIGEGDFILPLNANMRKAVAKNCGTTLKASLQLDQAPILPPKELLECFKDEPAALAYYNSLPQSHRNYFTQFIKTAKTDVTKTKRIAMVINAMVTKIDFGLMLRNERDERKKLTGK